jgi:hypothetical protein
LRRSSNFCLFCPGPNPPANGGSACWLWESPLWFVFLCLERPTLPVSRHPRKDLKLSILKTATYHDPHTLYLLQTVPGIGTMLSLVWLDEIHRIDRMRQRKGAFDTEIVLQTSGSRAGEPGA